MFFSMFVNGLLSAPIIYVQMQIKVNKKYLLIKTTLYIPFVSNNRETNTF